MSASLPPHPSLEWLRKSAKQRLREMRRVRPRARLADAQLEIAREYGFPSWRSLKAHVDRVAAPAASSAEERDVARFLRAVGTGHLDEVREMLAALPSLVNAVGPHPFWGGRPQALHVAIESNRRDIFELLLDRGAGVDGSNEWYDEWSPLMLAIQRDRPEMRDALLSRGARVGLTEALMLGDDRRVEEMLRDGSLPDHAPGGGPILAFARTPFAMDRLIALGAPTAGAEVGAPSAARALGQLGASGRPLVERLQAHGAPVDPEVYARMGDAATLERLVAADPAVARSDAVIIAAVESGEYDLVRWLLERGAPVNARAEEGSRHTPLHAAAWAGDMAMVELLVEAGADLSARDERHDSTPWGWARTAAEVTNNAACVAVTEYLEGREGRE